jgi:hypothetical protein
MSKITPLSNFSVLVHAYQKDDKGNESYAGEGDTIHGWCTYVREDWDKEDGQFDICEDHAFPTKEEALAKAQELATEYGGVSVEEY